MKTKLIAQTKALVYAIILFGSVALFVSCNKDDGENNGGGYSELIGTWICYEDDGDYEMYIFYADGTGISGEYYADGTEPDTIPIIYYYDESTNSLRYQEEDGDIFLYTAILNGDKLILMDEYGSETYVRQ